MGKQPITSRKKKKNIRKLLPLLDNCYVCDCNVTNKVITPLISILASSDAFEDEDQLVGQYLGGLRFY